MTHRLTKVLLMVALFTAALLASEFAHAFRCGSKIVRDGMHEQQVVAICGEPTTARQIGYAVRSFGHRLYKPQGSNSWHRHPAFGTLVTDVVVTEWVYNFGPRKLMRRLVFEGSVLVSIETIGYGYHVK
jgi:hypothetical protein